MTQPCQLCGGTHFESVSERDRHGKPLKTVICMGCGIITNDPIPTDDELAAFYKQYYRRDYKGADKPRMRQVWRNFGRIEQHLKDNRDVYRKDAKTLDLGSGSGEFSFLAKQMGMGIQSVEPNLDYALYCRDELGLDVTIKTLEEVDYPNGSFDMIRLSHVLEHMRDPVRSLKVLHRWLAQDGILYIEVPNIERDAELKMHGKMFHFGHIFNFNPFTLRLAARLAGFEEMPLTIERNAGKCSVFLVKAETSVISQEECAANAKAMKRAMDDHNARTLPKPREGSAFGRFLSTMRIRLSEITASRRFETHRDIAEYFGRKV